MEEEKKRELCREMMTQDPRLARTILTYFEEEDFQRISDHKTGGGVIGGKACGFVLVEKMMGTLLGEYADRWERCPSWFVGTEIFCQVRDGKTIETFRGEFERILNYFNGAPYIVRSSSLMEDGYDNAFFGKYESVFCSNQGTEEERIREMLNAVSRVYDSVKNQEAVEYRKKWHRKDQEEQMGLLIQKAAGTQIGSLYFPAAAGMGCSYNPYKWMEHINPEAGMLRLVAGLGTRAVTRTPGDYPRLVGLDCAQGNLWGTTGEKHKYSQRQVDVIDLDARKICTKNLSELLDIFPKSYRRLLLDRDTDAEELLARRGDYRKIYFADCQGLVEDRTFIRMMKTLLKKLEENYRQPVDIEFAVNASEDGWKVTLVQCRPLRSGISDQVKIPKDKDGEFLFDVRRTSMRRSKEQKLDYIVWVDPQAYYDYPYKKKPDVGHVIGKINHYLEETEEKALLLAPGRIGTSSPELGVPVSYADISSFGAICEVAYGKAGYRPELSYGSHMFQNLVEADVYYGAINENSKTRIYRPEMLSACPEVTERLAGESAAELLRIVKVYDVRGHAVLYLDAADGRAVCRLAESKKEKEES